VIDLSGHKIKIADGLPVGISEGAHKCFLLYYSRREVFES